MSKEPVHDAKPAPPAPPPPPVDPNAVLERGSEGEGVKLLQEHLNKALALKMDGVFGPLTDQAVRSFQINHGLVPDGIVGARTRKAITG